MLRLRHALAVLGVLAGSGCTTVEWATDTHGLPGADGNPRHYARIRHYGVDLFGLFPFELNTPDVLADELSGLVRDAGGQSFEVVIEEQNAYFLALPPISWIFTPVVSELGAVYVPKASGPATDR